MQRADVLSKVHTLWELWREFVESESVLATHGVTPMFPDVAKAGLVVAVVLARGVVAALQVVLPVWEGKSWWHLAQRGCKQCIRLGETHEVVSPNGHGFPRWDLCLCLF